MKIPNREITEFPYTRQNAEKLIRQAKDLVEIQLDFDQSIQRMDMGGEHGLSGYWEDRLVGGIAIDNFTGYVSDLIGATFPELLPIDWGFEQ